MKLGCYGTEKNIGAEGKADAVSNTSFKAHTQRILMLADKMMKTKRIEREKANMLRKGKKNIR